MKVRREEGGGGGGGNTSVFYLTRAQTNGIFLYPLHAQRFKNQTSESACPILTEKESQHELRLFCDFSELFDGGTVICVEISPIVIFFNCEYCLVSRGGLDPRVCPYAGVRFIFALVCYLAPV